MVINFIPGKFLSEKDHRQFKSYTDSWSDNSLPVKEVFRSCYHYLANIPGILFDFTIRPGVSASLKSYLRKNDAPHSRLLSVIDIIDQDARNIWLSVCFYADMISDPDDLGNLIPNGLLEEDGYCFDLFEDDKGLMKYIQTRIDEAYEKAIND